MSPRRLRAIVLAAIFTASPVGAPLHAAADDSRVTLDRYERHVKELQRQSQQQLEQIQQATASLGARFKGETVGKKWVSADGTDGGGSAVCHQKTVAFDLSDTPLAPVPPSTITASQFDAWFAQYVEFFPQARRWLDQTTQNQLAVLADARRELDDIDRRKGIGDEWLRRAYTDLLRRVPIEGFLHDAYGVVLQAYGVQLDLGVLEIGSSNMLGPAPIGLACIVESDASNEYFKDMVALRQTGLIDVCKAHVESRRDGAATEMRSWRQRLLTEREHIRQQMLHWREQLIAGGIYEGAGDAAISAVYGSPSQLSAENVNAHRWGFITDIWTLRVPRSPDNRLDLNDSHSAAPAWWRSNNYAYQPAMKVIIDNECGSPMPGSIKYADLEKAPYELQIDLKARRTRDGVAAGARRDERP